MGFITKSLPEYRCPMSDLSPPGGSSGPAEVAAYVATLAAELVILTHKAGLGPLEFLLAMVRLEAENVGRQERADSK